MVGEWKLDIESTKKMKKVKNSSKNIKNKARANVTQKSALNFISRMTFLLKTKTFGSMVKKKMNANVRLEVISKTKVESG